MVPSANAVYCPCYCADRKLYPALQAEVVALKAVIEQKAVEYQRSVQYADILMLEIEKLRAVIEKQSKDMNRSQRYLFTREATERRMTNSITTLQGEIKSAAILEAQNLELFERNRALQADMASTKARLDAAQDELKQAMEVKEKLFEEAVSIETKHVATTTLAQAQIKRAEQRAHDAEVALAQFKERVTKREQDFLIRDDLLMDKISRTQQSAFVAQAVANEMTDRFYLAKDAADGAKEQVQISNSRGAVTISRLEREREKLKSREAQLTDEKNLLQLQLVSIGTRQQTSAEFSSPSRAKSERRLSSSSSSAAAAAAAVSDTERRASTTSSSSRRRVSVSKSNKAKPTEEAGRRSPDSIDLLGRHDEATEPAGAAPSSSADRAGAAPSSSADRAGRRHLLSSFLSLLTNTAPAVEHDDDAAEALAVSSPLPDAAVVNLSRASLDDDDLTYVLEWLRLLPLHKTRRIDFRFNAITTAGLKPLAVWLEHLALIDYSRAPLYARAPLEIDVRHNNVDRSAAAERFLAVGARQDLNVNVTVEAGDGAVVVAYPDTDAADAALHSPNKKSFLVIRLRL